MPTTLLQSLCASKSKSCNFAALLFAMALMNAAISLADVGEPGQGPEGTPKRSLLAPDSNRMPNMLIVNAGDLFGGVLTVEYERGLTSLLGLSIGASLASFRGVFVPNVHTTIGPELGVRFHLIGDAPWGLWIGPSVSVFYVAERFGGLVYRQFGYGVGAGVGFNVRAAAWLAFQIGVAGGFQD